MKTLQQANTQTTRRRNDILTVPTRGDIAALISELRPSQPLYLTRPEAVAANARRFLTQFPGVPMYAVKCNPDKILLQAMIKAGIKAFDCASIDEVRLIRKLTPKAKIYFMHPVKAREAIREAYFTHGVRAFVLDCVDELYKIMQETDLAHDLELFVRMAVPVKSGEHSPLSLSGKFGATVEEVTTLLQHCRPVSVKLGVSFHVGSQCLKPERYAMAIKLAAQAIKASGVKVEVLDVGGGFPSTYPGSVPPAFELYMEAISQTVARQKLNGIELLCEPGRALVADSGTLVVRVEQRKGNRLHLNDGTYGSLFESGPSCRMMLPCRLIRANGGASETLAPFSFAGPTCDSYDMIEGPFMLPEDVREGDWIELGNIGAYGTSSRTRFNGFGETTTIIVKDQENQGNVIAL